MSYASLKTTAATYDVISFRRAIPLVGPWRADVECDVGADLFEETGQITFTIGDRALMGTIVETGGLAGRGRASIVGGYGGWGRVVPGRDYQEVLPRTLVTQLLTDSGEKMAQSTLDALPLSLFGFWTRAAGTAGLSLTTLARRLGLSWRIQDTGETWLGLDTYPAAASLGVLAEDAYGDDGALCVVPPGPVLEPGTTWTDGRRIDRVVESMAEGSQLITELLFEREVGPDMQRALFERAVRHVLRELPYLGRYPATVAIQREGGAVELLPDDATQAGTPAIPVLYGLPGARVEVDPGARVGLIYDGADPSRPRAFGWEQSTLATLIELDATEVLLGTDAARGVVRRDDKGTGGSFLATGPTLTYHDPDGVPLWSLTGLADTVTGVVSWTIVPITGDPGALVTKSTEASNNVKAE